MTSSREGGFSLPSLKRRGTGAPPAPIKTTPWMENALATQVTMGIPTQTAAPWLDISLPLKQHHTHLGGGAGSASL
jgi:hypothetical protein